MSRSSKKGPYVDLNLEKKVKVLQDSNSAKPIQTWSRACTIIPSFVGITFNVHNGMKFIPVFITEAMVGHKLGEFSPTRMFRSHPVK